jgi:hypothetical protein
MYTFTPAMIILPFIFFMLVLFLACQFCTYFNVMIKVHLGEPNSVKEGWTIMYKRN